MPRFYLLDRHYLRADTELAASLHEAGEVVDFSDCDPGASMIALDSDARDAKARVEKSRTAGANDDAKRVEAHGRRGLAGFQKKLIAEAEAKIQKA